MKGDLEKKSGEAEKIYTPDELAARKRFVMYVLEDGSASERRQLAEAEAAPLHQVLLNLLVNAVHAIEEACKQGRVSGHFIRIGVEKKDAQFVLYMQDSGCGISETNLRNLFKPCFTTKDIGVGTGLGLATSYRIGESWGGSISVESKEGIGTTFKVLLPGS